MTKQSKLTERGVRMPDIREVEREKIIARYLKEVEPLQSEPARAARFAMLLNELFGFVPQFIEEYLQGFEKHIKIKKKDFFLRGRADNLFGNLIIEFERNLPKTRAEAEAQLCLYVAICWSQEAPQNRTPYLCLAGDGVRFVAYSPTLVNPQAQNIDPQDVKLQILEEVDFTKLQTETFFWIDRYFLRKENYPPTSQRMVGDFGPYSHAFKTVTAALLSLWQGLKEQNPFAVIFSEWEKYLRIVYGSKVSGEELFIRHTYLATLAKLMAYIRLTDSKTFPDDARIMELLEGRFFKAQGIDNFLEEDFFSWLGRPPAAPTAIIAARGLFSLLKNYNLPQMAKEGEDIWKSLYQELVDPATRHDLGEFYTPDWLAHRMINKMLTENPRASMLDPACGSGTFLYLAIREKRRRLGDAPDTLRQILDAVVGADIHPLAVIIAKTNYILALGDLLKKRRETVTIPVYLADTLWLPERYMQGPEYVLHLDDETVYVPEELLQDIGVYDQAMELAKEFAQSHLGQPVSPDLFFNFLKAQNFPAHANPYLVQKIYAITLVLKDFIDHKRDTIWAFVLKNRFKPLFFKSRFDFLLGNPPWIAFRYLEPKYQEFVKRMVTQRQHYRLLEGRGHLITHLEVAALFLVRAADLYLKKGGTVGLVMPRSLLTADQHDGLRRGDFRFIQDTQDKLAWQELWDCEKIEPLFNVPACVLWGEKNPVVGVKKTFPGEILAGRLPTKNASLEEAYEHLTLEPVIFSLSQRGHRSYWGTGKGVKTSKKSWYHKKFFQGATIVPRSFWFVRVKPSPLGFDHAKPPLETDPRAIKEAKAPYKDVRMEGQVEAPFLYATLLSTDLLPFAHLDYRLVVLPLETQEKYYHLLNAENAGKEGFSGLAGWLEKVEEEWVKKRGPKAENLTALEWLNYRKKLTSQDPRPKYRVIYNSSGTNLTATALESKPIKLTMNGQEVNSSGFLADHVTYCFETNEENEAYYLASILNAPKIDQLIKPLQARGLWGARHIHKKVLELPIPRFKEGIPQHMHMAQMGQDCARKVQDWLALGGPGTVKSIGRLRGMVRQMLKDELAQIDALVQQILG